MTESSEHDPLRTQAEGDAPDERRGWALVGVAVLVIVAQFASIPFIRHSHVMVGLMRGIGILPVILGASGGKMIVAARKARKNRPND